METKWKNLFEDIPSGDCEILVKEGLHYTIGQFKVHPDFGWFVWANGLMLLKENFTKHAKYIELDLIKD